MFYRKHYFYMSSNNQRAYEISNLYKDLSFSENTLNKLLISLDSLENYSMGPGDFSLNFVDEAKICELHETFMSDPSPTDVITFKGDKEMDFAGEVFVSVDQALKVHKEYNHTFEEELTLYIVHGWLHLVGYDDIQPEDRLKMKKAEVIVMNRVKKLDSIPNFSIDANHG